MASILKMIVLGIVQGATEFLPVSSSGHLTIAQEFLGISENRILFDVFLHLGTVAAVLLVFGKDVLALLSSKRRWIPYLVAASVPAAAVGILLESQIERVFHSVLAVGALLIANSLILGFASRARKKRATIEDVEAKGALVVGVAQSMAILPGISRSGSTVCAGLLMGWDRKLAVRFSFILAIPAILGAAALHITKCHSALSAGDVLAMAFAGLLVSAATGYVALRLFIRILEKGKLWVFSAYCLLLGAGILMYELVR